MFEQTSLQRALPYYQQIQQTIKTRIFQGVYKPGDRLYEAQIAKEFAISRSPVREAIRALVNEGLIIMDEKSQLSVYKPSLQDVRDIYECRVALESTAVALATERITGKDLAELEKVLEDTNEAIKRGEKEEIIKYNALFHECIIDYSGNMRLKKMVDDLHSLTYYYRVLNMEGPDRASVILKGHRDIFTAMKEKNPDEAAKKLTEHTQEDLENLIKLIG
ncbi:GntR family transcriptional regulator [Bacillus sp. V3-13]|uniref:GntR family transcriptional regulator n=1 Tax=Bacillus sp. V3-13 TaxID=2053728 RepID=UPI000C7950EA|nr:GntR family transcriptional regulator [Bacillus sp. V3-13]PLR75893.1 GntR family transcriptional regulator [Bacillus sp. V3-13]